MDKLKIQHRRQAVTSALVSLAVNAAFLLLWLVVSRTPLSEGSKFFLWAIVLATAFVTLVLIIIDLKVELRISRHLKNLTVDEIKTRK